MSVTIVDVAKEAGVSITTVSRVLNNNYPVKKQTRENIEKAIEKLNYAPNAVARSLITKKTFVIGVVVPGITNLFFPTVVEAIENSIKDNGYSTILCNTYGDKEEEKKLLETVESRMVDGIIIIDPTYENLKSKLFERISERIPVVIINGAPQNDKCNYVCYDEEKGAKEAFNYLLKLGHKKIAFIRGEKSFSYDIKEKIYSDFVKENNLNYKNVFNIGDGNSLQVVKKSEKLLNGMLNSDEMPTAIFACNDLMAIGVINVCNKLNIRIPEDLSIIGFDNTLLADISHPALTSVNLNMVEVGNRAATEIIDIIENKVSHATKVILDTELVIRKSCSKKF